MANAATDFEHRAAEWRRIGQIDVENLVALAASQCQARAGTESLDKGHRKIPGKNPRLVWAEIVHPGVKAILRPASPFNNEAHRIVGIVHPAERVAAIVVERHSHARSERLVAGKGKTPASTRR